MEIEDRDFFGRATRIDVPVPIATPGTILVRTAYSWKWPYSVSAPPHSAAPVTRLVGAALWRGWRTLRHAGRAIARADHRGWRLALDHHLGAHEHFVRSRHTCASISGSTDTCGEGVPGTPWAPGTPVAGFGFTAPPDAAFQLLSPQFLVPIPDRLDLAVASLLMPAAMVRDGLDRAVSTRRVSSMVICGANAHARVAALYARELAVRIEWTIDVPTRVPAGSLLVVVSGDAPPDGVFGPDTLWIQSAPSAPEVVADARRRGLDMVAIPDPWSESNLDVLSEDTLEVPAWATRGHLRATVAWLTRAQRDILRTLPPASWQIPVSAARRRVVAIGGRRRFIHRRPLRVGFIGAGEFAPMLLKHVLQEKDVVLRGIADLRPVRARFAADLYGFQFCAACADAVLADEDTDCVFVVTDHHSHAALAAAALRAGKYVFVEKPPAVDGDQLRMLLRAMATSRGALQVGYNRNFAPLVRRLREWLDAESGPVDIHIERRPYPVRRNSWYYWPKEGTRIVSNVCHFLDLAYNIAGRPQPRSVATVYLGEGRPDEHAAVRAAFVDGSTVTVRFSNDVTTDESLLVKRDRWSARLCGYSRLEIRNRDRVVAAWSEPADFGHAAEISAFLRGCRERRPAFDSPADLAATSALTFAARESLLRGAPVAIVMAA